MNYKDLMNVKNWAKNKSKAPKVEIVQEEPVTPVIAPEVSVEIEKPKPVRKPRTKKVVSK